MRDADQVARACGLGRVGRMLALVHHLAARMRLERIIDVLHDIGPAALDAIDALVKPADGGPERRAVCADFPFLHELVHQFPQRVVLDLRHADVVELQDVDVVGVKALQRLFHRLADEGDGKVLRDFALALALVAVVVKIVADLGRNHDLVALFGERPGDELLAVAVAVGISGIEKRDAEIERLVHERDRLAFREVAPPAGRDGPKSKTDFRDAKVGLRQCAKFHAPTLGQRSAPGKAARPRSHRQ